MASPAAATSTTTSHGSAGCASLIGFRSSTTPRSAIEWIHWQSGTAQLLPRLIARRTRGPLFLTDRKAPAGTPTLDVCSETGWARLSYRRAEETIEENTRLLANLPASPEDIEDLNGWTLHRLRHSALTHDAEGGTSTPMLLVRSRHASVCSLERYARASVDAVARHVADHPDGPRQGLGRHDRRGRSHAVRHRPTPRRTAGVSLSGA
ncbi:site-specific integrase [Streptomyces sp. NPDC002343]